MMMPARGPTAALAAFAAPSTRVRLLFADALEHVVARQRGFAACWFLVPPRVRVIGDLMHEIAREFELLACCPDGLELVMEGFHLLANQSIELLRDNDAIVVQCPIVVEESAAPDLGLDHDVVAARVKDRKKEKGNTCREKRKRSSSESSEAEAAEESKKRRKSKTEATKAQTDQGVAKKTKAAAVAAEPKKKETKKPKKGLAEEATRTHALLERVKRRLGTSENGSSTKDTSSKPVQPMESSSSSSSSSFSSSDDGSSSDDSSSSSSSSSSSDEPSSDDDAAPVNPPRAPQPTQAATGRTRRRRRLRRRPKVGDAPSTPAQTAAPPVSHAARHQTEPAPEPSTTIRPLRLRGVPQAVARAAPKNHKRFDGSAHETPVDLQKYAPPPVEAAPPQRHERSQPTANRGPKPKAPPVDKWKRPYEVLASIHDTPLAATTSASTRQATVAELVQRLPERSVKDGLGARDVIAYRTLSLCLETFQPVQSDWLGAVVSTVDTATETMTVEPQRLTMDCNDQLQWSCNSSDAVIVSLSEICDLRLLQRASEQ